jgi:hypothetical protein
MIRFLLATTRFIETVATNLHLYALTVATANAKAEQLIAKQAVEDAQVGVEQAAAELAVAKAYLANTKGDVATVAKKVALVVTAANAEADLVRTGAKVA